MKTSISVDIDAVSSAIQRIRDRGESEALTSDIIAEYMGGFIVNKGVPVHLSWNAQFGKILSDNSYKNAGELRIEQLRDDHPTKPDSCGNISTCSRWNLYPASSNPAPIAGDR